MFFMAIPSLEKLKTSQASAAERAVQHLCEQRDELRSELQGRDGF